VAAAWIWIVVQSVSAKAKPARSTIYMMGIATAVLLSANRNPHRRLPGS